MAYSAIDQFVNYTSCDANVLERSKFAIKSKRVGVSFRGSASDPRKETVGCAARAPPLLKIGHSGTPNGRSSVDCSCCRRAYETVTFLPLFDFAKYFLYVFFFFFASP